MKVYWNTNLKWKFTKPWEQVAVVWANDTKCVANNDKGHNLQKKIQYDFVPSYSIVSTYYQCSISYFIVMPIVQNVNVFNVSQNVFRMLLNFNVLDKASLLVQCKGKHA